MKRQPGQGLHQATSSPLRNLVGCAIGSWRELTVERKGADFVAFGGEFAQPVVPLVRLQCTKEDETTLASAWMTIGATDLNRKEADVAFLVMW